ncbi:MAG TPA: ABC transporter permease [Armatimonadota bacterium]|nr:ABC transporter permease [Armatimonadota bacterium]
MTTLVIAKNTLGEALRKKIIWIFLLVALGMIVISVSFAFFSMREEQTIIKSFGLGIIAIVGMFIAIILGINLVPAEIEQRTIYTILSKPVHRHEFLLGKFFGSLMTILVSLVFMAAVFMVTVTYRSHWHPDFALLKGVLMIFFQLVLLSSVAMVFSVFATPVVNFFLTSSIYIIGSLSDITMVLGKSKELNPIMKGFYWLLHYLLPNFANFFTQNPLIHPEVAIENETAYYLKAITYAIVYSCALLIVAILKFERRDM